MRFIMYIEWTASHLLFDFCVSGAERLAATVFRNVSDYLDWFSSEVNLGRLIRIPILSNSNIFDSIAPILFLRDRPLMDSTNFIGFYITLFDHFCIIFSYYILYVGATLLHIGFCSHLNAFVEDYALQMHNLDDEISKQNAWNECNTGRIRATLVDSVEMHVKVTRWVVLLLFINYLSTY